MARSLTSGLQVRSTVAFLALLMVASAATGPPQDRSRNGRPGQPSTLAATYRPQLASLLQSIADGDDFETARGAVLRLFDDVTARAEVSDLELFRDTSAAVRMVRLVGTAEPANRADLMQFMLAHREFAQALVFAINFDEDDKAGVFALIERLREKHTAAIDEFPHLAAAICLVHDTPLARRINENKVESPDPLALFEFYAEHDGQTAFSVKQMPVELLTYVVDSTADIEEMAWAVSRFRSKRDIGELFFAIKYDYDHLNKGTQKEVTRLGYSLPNILRYGGVCADQAYFACAVGKSIGIPTAYTVGASGEVAHAWVGFLRSNRRSAWWDFESGRYDAYKGVRGVVTDPQTRTAQADSTINLLAAYAVAPQLERYASIAMTDCAKRLLEAESGKTAVPFVPTEGGPALVRGATKEDALELLEDALRTCPGYAEAWFMVGKLARGDRLSFKEKQYWANVLHRLCGETYPDFYFAVVAPMIETVDDVSEQSAMWDAAFETFRKRHDLAAAVRMRQAAMWRDAGENARAGTCCEDVITRYANAGPFVLGALEMAENLLVEMNRRERIPALYEQAWSLTKKPEPRARQFYMQSNWYRVGMRFAAALEQAGRTQDATKVRQTLNLG